MSEQFNTLGTPGNANLSTIARSAKVDLPLGPIVGNKGWSSREYLPHFDGDEVIQHVTFHLADSLPTHLLKRLDDELCTFPSTKQDSERRKRMEALIDAGYGSCVLRESAMADMAQNALFFFDNLRYRLLAWVIMPNHIHTLLLPINEWTLAKIVASWKKFTAKNICAFRRIPGNANLPIGPIGNTGANQEIGVPGRVWHREFWDRYIRDERHYQQVIAYIHNNPKRAGLVEKAEDWPWSSLAMGRAITNRESL